LEKLIIFSAPSGSGKTTVVKHLLSVMDKQLAFSVSATTRSPRPGETNGLEYHFLNLGDFHSKIQEGAFLEHEEVYAGILYGTLWSEVRKIWSEGKAVVFDVDVKGGLNLKRQFGDRALAVFFASPKRRCINGATHQAQYRSRTPTARAHRQSQLRIEL
jgi:guanylate kinase